MDTSEFKQRHVDAVLPFLTKCLKNSSVEASTGLLYALSRILYDHGVACQKYADELLPPLLNLSHVSVQNARLRQQAIHCIGHICAKCGGKLTPLQLEECLGTLLQNLDYTSLQKLDYRERHRVSLSTIFVWGRWVVLPPKRAKTCSPASRNLPWP
jgi:hypothetical protein